MKAPIIVAGLLSACAPCEPSIAEGATRGWCEPIVVTAYDCAEETAEAIALWDVDMAMGDHGHVTVRLGTLSQYDGQYAGVTFSRWVGRETKSSEITVIQCSVQLIAHELGHALGYPHTSDEHSIMYGGVLTPASWEIP